MSQIEHQSAFFSHLKVEHELYMRRERIATAALQGLLARNNPVTPESNAIHAIQCARAPIAELDKEK